MVSAHARSSHLMRKGRYLVLIISCLLAYLVSEWLFPTPNIVGGGGMKMCLLILLFVVFKAAIEYFLNKRLRK